MENEGWHKQERQARDAHTSCALTPLFAVSINDNDIILYHGGTVRVDSEILETSLYNSEAVMDTTHSSQISSSTKNDREMLRPQSRVHTQYTQTQAVQQSVYTSKVRVNDTIALHRQTRHQWQTL